MSDTREGCADVRFFALVHFAVPPTLLGNLTEKCMRRLTIQEVVMIFGGNHEPLKSIHGTLREFIQDVILEGTEPTAELIPKAIDSFLEGLPAVLRGIDVSRHGLIIAKI